MKTKIVMLLSNGFDPDPRVHNEAVALIEKGYEVTLICWDRSRGLKKRKKEIIDGIDILRIGPRSKHNLGSFQVFFILFFWVGVFSKVLLKRTHVIHCHDFDTLPVGFLLAKLKNCKLVYDAHENYSKMIQYDVSAALGNMIDVVERQLIKHVDLTLTVGDILASEYREREANNVHVVGNWKNTSNFIFDNEELIKLRKTLGVRGKKELIISYITTLKEERSIIQLIEAVQGQEDFVLILGGKGPLEEVIKEVIRKHHNIKYLGFVNPSDVPKYTALSDIIFYGFDTNNENSKYSAPNKLFEALAAGKALITGKVGEVGLIVDKFECGLVLENYSPSTIRSALNYFVSFPDKLALCKKNAYLLGKTKYNWDSAKETLCCSYEMLNTIHQQKV
jgi:glycosyltransferase involved in cell wall biosynthesis